MKKFIIFFLFLTSCVNNSFVISKDNLKITSSNIKLDLGPGSKGIDYNLGPSSKGITNLKLNVSFIKETTNYLKIEIIKNNDKKVSIDFLSIKKENLFYIDYLDLEKGVYKIKAVTGNGYRNISIENYLELNSNKEIKVEIYNYKEKPELLDISINTK